VFADGKMLIPSFTKASPLVPVILTAVLQPTGTRLDNTVYVTHASSHGLWSPHYGTDRNPNCGWKISLGGISNLPQTMGYNEDGGT